MNVLDVLIWTLSARIVIGILDRPALSRWIVLGIVLGLGLETKIDVLWLGAGLAAGLLLTPARGFCSRPARGLRQWSPGCWSRPTCCGRSVTTGRRWSSSEMPVKAKCRRRAR